MFPENITTLVEFRQLNHKKSIFTFYVEVNKKSISTKNGAQQFPHFYPQKNKIFKNKNLKKKILPVILYKFTIIGLRVLPLRRS